MKSPKKESESSIQLEIMRHLRKQGHLFWRFSPDTYVQAIGRYIKHEYVPNGLPDIMILTDKLIGLEIKQKSGRASADQILMKKRFESLGHEYHVVKSLDEVKSLGL
jgi:hypothetical protein